MEARILLMNQSDNTLHHLMEITAAMEVCQYRHLGPYHHPIWRKTDGAKLHTSGATRKQCSGRGSSHRSTGARWTMKREEKRWLGVAKFEKLI